MGRKHGRRSYLRKGRSAQSLRPPPPPSDSRRVAQGDAVRDGHGGDPSRHPGQHLATPDGPAKRAARLLRPGRAPALLLPEPPETGGRDPRAACRGPAGHPQDEGADRPGEGAGEEGTGGFPWMKGAAPLFWTTTQARPAPPFREQVGGEILACGTCLKLRNSQGSEPCPLSAMKDLHALIREADRVGTF